MNQIINKFRNTKFVFFFKFMLLEEMIKLLKPTNKSIWLKIKSTKKLPILSVSYQHIVNNISTIWTRILSYLGILDLFIFFKSMSLGIIIKVLKSTNKIIWLKIMPNKKLLILLVSYQHVVSKVPIIWASYQHIQEY